MIAILTNSFFVISGILALGSILLTILQYGADWQNLSSQRDSLGATRKLRVTVYHPREPILDAVVYHGNFGGKASGFIPDASSLQSGFNPALQPDLRPDLRPHLRVAA